MTEPVAARTSGMAIAGFVLSFLCGLLGLIFSILGLLECNRTGMKGRGLAIAGIIISCAMTVLALLATIAIPAFLDYMHKGKKQPVVVELANIEKAIKASVKGAGLPVGTTPRIPKAGCCTFPTGRCETTPMDWRDDPIWLELEYRGVSRSYFQYAYESDGKSFVVRAFGDLDCDGTEVTWELRGRMVDGELQVDPVVAPPPNTD
jgi:Domain of unknown function (DUF4190)